MQNYKVQVNLVRRDNPEELVESFTFDMASHQTLGIALGQALLDRDIDVDDLEFYKVVIELVEEEE